MALVRDASWKPQNDAGKFREPEELQHELLTVKKKMLEVETDNKRLTTQLHFLHKRLKDERGKEAGKENSNKEPISGRDLQLALELSNFEKDQLRVQLDDTVRLLQAKIAEFRPKAAPIYLAYNSRDGNTHSVSVPVGYARAPSYLRRTPSASAARLNSMRSPASQRSAMSKSMSQQSTASSSASSRGRAAMQPHPGNGRAAMSAGGGRPNGTAPSPVPQRDPRLAADRPPMSECYVQTDETFNDLLDLRDRLRSRIRVQEDLEMRTVEMHEAKAAELVRLATETAAMQQSRADLEQERADLARRTEELEAEYAAKNAELQAKAEAATAAAAPASDDLDLADLDTGEAKEKSEGGSVTAIEDTKLKELHDRIAELETQVEDYKQQLQQRTIDHRNQMATQSQEHAAHLDELLDALRDSAGRLSEERERYDKLEERMIEQVKQFDEVLSRPKWDLWQNDEKLMLSVDVPGVTNLEVAVDDDEQTLLLHGALGEYETQEVTTTYDALLIHRLPEASPDYNQRLQVPVPVSRIVQTKYENGTVYITLTKLLGGNSSEPQSGATTPKPVAGSPMMSARGSARSAAGGSGGQATPKGATTLSARAKSPRPYLTASKTGSSSARSPRTPSARNSLAAPAAQR